MHTGFVLGDLRERDLLEDLELVGRTTLNWILKKWDMGMDWLDLRSMLV